MNNFLIKKWAFYMRKGVKRALRAPKELATKYPVVLYSDSQETVH